MFVHGLHGFVKMRTPIRKGAFMLLATTACTLGSNAPESSSREWTKQHVLQLIDEATRQPSSSFILHRTLEKSCSIAATSEQHDFAHHVFDLDPLRGIPTSVQGEETIVSDGLSISIEGHHDQFLQQHLVDGQLRADVYRNPEDRYHQVLTDVGWYVWYTGDTMLGIRSAPNVPFTIPFYGPSSFSRLWCGLSGAAGRLTPGQLELLNLESVHVQDGVLVAQLGHDQHPSAPAEDQYRVVSKVQIELDAGGGPRLLSYTSASSYMYDGVRTFQTHVAYSVTEWMKVGDIDIPRTATLDQFLFAPFMATDPGLSWCPKGQMCRITMTHEDYRPVTQNEATKKLTRIPEQEGVSVFAEDLGLSYKLGLDTVWMDGEPYALPEPILEHPVNGFERILESSTFLPISEIQMTEDVESKAAISPWASSKVLIGLVVVAFLLLVAGLWRRWKAAV